MTSEGQRLITAARRARSLPTHPAPRSARQKRLLLRERCRGWQPSVTRSCAAPGSAGPVSPHGILQHRPPSRSYSCAKVATAAASSTALPCVRLAHQWGEAHVAVPAQHEHWCPFPLQIHSTTTPHQTGGRGKKDSALHRKPYNNGVLLLTMPTPGCKHTKYSHFLLQFTDHIQDFSEWLISLWCFGTGWK